MSTKAKASSSMIKFLKNSSLFFIGTILSKALTFFLLPLYSYLIPTEDMGVYDISITIMTIVASICFFEIWTGVLRKVYENKTHEDKLSIISDGLKIFLISSLAFIALCVGISFIIGYKYKIWILTYMLTYMLTNFFTFAARGLGYNKRFAFSGFLCSLITVTLNLILLLVLNFDYSALYISATLGFAGQILFLLISCKLYKIIPLVFSKKPINTSLVKFCMPLCVNTIAYWCLTSLNRVIFNSIYGDSASGIFALGARFSTLVLLVTTCFTYAWQDLSFSESDENSNACALYTKGSNLYMCFLTIGFLTILPFLYFLSPYLIKGDYVAAIPLLPLFILSSMISGFSSFLGSTFYAIKDTKSILITTLVGTFINLVLCYPLIKLFGPNGVNLSTCISFIGIIITRAMILRKKINFKIKKEYAFYSMFFIILTSFVFIYCDWRMNSMLFLTGVCGLLYLAKRLFLKKDN